MIIWVTPFLEFNAQRCPFQREFLLQKIGQVALVVFGYRTNLITMNNKGRWVFTSLVTVFYLDTPALHHGGSGFFDGLLEQGVDA